MEVCNRNDKITFSIVEKEKLDNSKKYKINIAIPMEYGWIEPVDFVVKKGWETLFFRLNHVENKDGYAYFGADVELETRAIYQYFFQLYINGDLKLVKKENVSVFRYEETFENNERKIKKTLEKTDDKSVLVDEMWKMSVNFDVPKWAMGRMMYHIFVDRFYRGSEDEMKEMPRRQIHHSWDEPVVVGPDKDGIWNNDFYGGDLKGITKKLDYICSLGVEILYLSPIVYSQSTHRYDASDYEMVDPYAGNLDDLKELCLHAHKRGMKVILDAVFNHTGSDSRYFNQYENPEWNEGKGAYNDKNSPYRKFYKWKYNDVTKDMEAVYWWDFKNLPVCDGNSEEWIKYITGKGGIIDKWFACGIDGLRLDVADELTDAYIEKINIAVSRNKPDGFIIGEVWKNPMYMNRSYIVSGKGMHTVMNYNFIGELIKYFRYGDVVGLANKIREIKNTYPDGTLYTMMNFTSTHDMTRGINLWDIYLFLLNGEWPWNLTNEDHRVAQNYKLDIDKYNEAKKIYKAYVFFMAFMPGILSIFYGDEIGMQGIGNLDNRKPMQWGKVDNELLEYFKMVGNIRKQEEFLCDAEWIVHDININYAAFERIKNENKMLVIVNRTPFEQTFVVPYEYEKSKKIYTLNKSKKRILTPYGGIAIRI